MTAARMIWERILTALLIAFAVAIAKHALAQGVPIGALPNATTPLSGSEYTILSQNGTTVKATVAQVIVPGITIPTGTLLGNNTGSTTAAVALSASAVRTLLGLGTAALANTGTSGHTLGYMDISNTWSALQTFSGGISIASLSIDTLNVTGTSNLGNASAAYAVVTGGALRATLATNAGGLTIAPFSASTAVTGALNATTTITAGTGLTVTTGGAAITGNSSIASGTFTASGGAFTASPAGANVVLSPTGAGVVTIAPATAGTLNNMVIGGSTPLAGTFTTATASTAFRGTDFGSGSSTTVSLTTTGGTQLQVLDTASASRNVTITGSNGGNPTINVTAGALAVTPATVFSSSLIANTLQAQAGLTLSGSSAPLTLNASVGTSGQVLTSAGAGATPTWASAGIAWAGAKTTAFNAAANTQYCIDTATTGAVTMTLPASPADGDKIAFLDCKSNFAIANFTVARNGKTIMGLAADMTVNTPNAAATLVYITAYTDWRMF